MVSGCVCGVRVCEGTICERGDYGGDLCGQRGALRRWRVMGSIVIKF